MHNFVAGSEGVGANLRWAFGTPNAGQAEILYRRNSVFKVESISEDGNDILVVVRASTPEQAGGNLKNPVNGQQTSFAKSRPAARRYRPRPVIGVVFDDGYDLRRTRTGGR